MVLFPDLYPDNPRRAARHDELSFLVSRQIIEIRDAQLALRPYVDPAVAQHARKLIARSNVPADQVEAFVEATQVKAALQAMEEGNAQQHTTTVPHHPAAGDMGIERDWLIRVATAFRSSDFIKDAIAQAETLGAVRA
ncbi:hypothetical protein GCM10010256_77960 [Streptomyces coeruleorubidus]|nr:hypothetical protein GCM10010256_77960 [Streptomyces coeruleorubidus]